MNEKDAGSKYIIVSDLEGWARWLLDDDSIEVLEELSVDFKFIGREPDIIFKVVNRDGVVFLVHIELQVKIHPEMPARVQNYCALGREKYKLPIVPIVMYLVKSDKPTPTEYHHEFMGLVTHQDFIVFRLWEIPVERAFDEGVPTTFALFAPLLKGATEQTLEQCSSYIRQHPNGDQLTTVFRIFASVNFDGAVIEKVLGKAMLDEEVMQTPIYMEMLDYIRGQSIERGIEQGIEKGIEKSTLRIITRRFGSVSDDLEQQIRELKGDDLDDLLNFVIDAETMAQVQARIDTYNVDYDELPEVE